MICCCFFHSGLLLFLNLIPNLSFIACVNELNDSQVGGEAVFQKTYEIGQFSPHPVFESHVLELCVSTKKLLISSLLFHISAYPLTYYLTSSLLLAIFVYPLTL